MVNTQSFEDPKRTKERKKKKKHNKGRTNFPPLASHPSSPAHEVAASGFGVTELHHCCVWFCSLHREKVMEILAFTAIWAIFQKKLPSYSSIHILLILFLWQTQHMVLASALTSLLPLRTIATDLFQDRFCWLLLQFILHTTPSWISPGQHLIVTIKLQFLPSAHKAGAHLWSLTSRSYTNLTVSLVSSFCSTRYMKLQLVRDQTLILRST